MRDRSSHSGGNRPDPFSDDAPGKRWRHRRGGRRGGRLFDYGELRLLVLAMIDQAPSHGYELIKSIEERFSGRYSPSPGVIYPTLAWLDDMGYVQIDAEHGGRKRYAVTEDGKSFLEANRAAAEDLLSRSADTGPDDPVPAPVIRAMENLKLALRLRIDRGAIDQETADKIAAALDAAAQAVERS
ncbi:PadR family transcriptional regulator [Amorphus sp. 3PC139-8]|uniref:PadR family transcriptional regulator n=1 Tax=Amorphus sp. 3PC139-8 TaxID=2735676 RepID=UPI00345C8A58